MITKISSRYEDELSKQLLKGEYWIYIWLFEKTILLTIIIFLRKEQNIFILIKFKSLILYIIWHFHINQLSGNSSFPTKLEVWLFTFSNLTRSDYSNQFSRADYPDFFTKLFREASFLIFMWFSISIYKT